MIDAHTCRSPPFTSARTRRHIDTADFVRGFISPPEDWQFHTSAAILDADFSPRSQHSSFSGENFSPIA
jgi:hypothetical protein